MDSAVSRAQTVYCPCVALKTFGTHSIHEGAVTHTASGITSPLPVTSICIQVNWSMPCIMNRFIVNGYPCHQYIGRCVFVCTQMDKRFAESIPHFHFLSFKQRKRRQWCKPYTIGLRVRCPRVQLKMKLYFAYWTDGRHQLSFTWIGWG